jgi:nucleoside 2-deoxyribosyltransferase
MKIYLAGPLFTSAESEWNRQLACLLTARGFEVWLPQEQEPRERTSKAIFEKDVEGVDWADVIVANMDGPDPDSGTCWECGYAYAKKKPILAYRTDFRAAGDSEFAPYNLMLSESATKRLRLPFSAVILVAAALVEELHAMEGRVVLKVDLRKANADKLEPPDHKRMRVFRVAKALEDELRDTYFTWKDSVAVACKLLAAADDEES